MSRENKPLIAGHELGFVGYRATAGDVSRSSSRVELLEDLASEAKADWSLKTWVKALAEKHAKEGPGRGRSMCLGAMHRPCRLEGGPILGQAHVLDARWYGPCLGVP